jgi:hypothetical protein
MQEKSTNRGRRVFIPASGRGRKWPARRERRVRERTSCRFAAPQKTWKGPKGLQGRQGRQGQVPLELPLSLLSLLSLSSLRYGFFQNRREAANARIC